MRLGGSPALCQHSQRKNESSTPTGVRIDTKLLKQSCFTLGAIWRKPLTSSATELFLPSPHRMLLRFHGTALEGFQNVVAVLVRVAIAVMKDCDQKQLGVGEGLTLFMIP